ncbi:MAG: hypothetical protein VB066_02345 [Paludibacter sp.]|nr:hypothetical protein [Paludibacter sp.]
MISIKNYTVFPYEAIQYFSPRDIYTLSVLYLYSINVEVINNKEYYVCNLTVEQIASYGNIKKDYIADNFLPRLKQSNYVIVETKQEKHTVKRNIYKLPKPKNNFRFIYKDILTDSLSPELKGFLISLFCCCDNNTPHCRYNTDELLQEIKINRASFFRYKKELMGEYIFSDKVKSIYGSQYSSGIDIRCSWLRIHPQDDISKETYIYPNAEVFADF